jgi:hypothetical protein
MNKKLLIISILHLRVFSRSNSDCYSAGYPSVPGVIGNGMDLVELITGKSVRKKIKAPESLATVE